MEYIYSALLLHKAGKQINEEAVKKVLEAVDVKVDDARVKVLVASLEGVDIKKAIETQQALQVAPAAAPVSEKKESKKEEKKPEEAKKADETAAAGLGALFG
ncbi:MAG: 50S ribosomal protein P1 [Clostridiales bacterium GWF2_36_10]|nr:MAG: 50S ribosomal protein P1 [Clostridiales bacterium GWF2_36_10]